MTQPNTLPEHPQEPARNDLRPPPASDFLLHLLLSLLAPMFLLGSNGDIQYARLAALGTINAYRARDEADLISVVQIVAFGLATLGSLSLSMADDLSLNMVLRLRGNANACSRSGEQHRRALLQDRPVHDPRPPEAEAPPSPAPPAPRQEQQAPAAAPSPVVRPPAMTQHQAIWTAAMAAVAEEYAAELPNLPPEERGTAVLRANALNYCINEMSSGPKASPPDPAVTGPPRP